jgi:excisionase family DNA binding protein
VTTPPEPPDTSITPLARARRRVEARLRLLDDKRVDHLDDDALWARYLDTVNTLVNLVGQAGSPPMVTTQQLAEGLGCSPETIRELVKQGRLEPAAKFGRRGGFRFRAGQRPTSR